VVAAVIGGGVDTGATTSTGGMVRLASATVMACSGQGGGNILMAMMKGSGAFASMGAGGGKGKGG